MMIIYLKPLLIIINVSFLLFGIILDDLIIVLRVSLKINFQLKNALAVIN